MLLDAGIVHQDVERPERGGRLVDEAPDLVHRADVGRQDDAADAVRRHLRQRRRGRGRGADVVDGHVRAFPREANGDAPPDAPAAAGHQRVLSPQSQVVTGHVVPRPPGWSHR